MGPMKLYVYLDYGDGEEQRELGECETTDDADAMLAEFEQTDEDGDEGEWSCADLFDCNHRPVSRRTPESPWVKTSHWPTRVGEEIPSIGDDAEAIASWLRSVGFRPSWKKTLRSPWPGRERGFLRGGPILNDPFAALRDMKHHNHDPVWSIVMLMLQDGCERGALIWREKHRRDCNAEAIDDLREDKRLLRAENAALRAELAAIKKGTP